MPRPHRRGHSPSLFQAEVHLPVNRVSRPGSAVIFSGGDRAILRLAAEAGRICTSGLPPLRSWRILCMGDEGTTDRTDATDSEEPDHSKGKLNPEGFATRKCRMRVGPLFWVHPCDPW
jgi:hypothetical protein